jgi:hypothetical protein
MQLEQDPQVPGNVKTSDADSNRRRQTPDSSMQYPDYEPPDSPRSRRELATNTYSTTRNQKLCQITAAGEPSCVSSNVT